MSDAEMIWDAIDQANSAWLDGRPTDTAELFAADARLVAPGLIATVDGRDAIVQTYVDFVDAASTDQFEVTERSLLIRGDTAVAAYVFDVTYQLDHGSQREQGQEVLVLRREDERWQVFWRTQLPLPPSSGEQA